MISSSNMWLPYQTSSSSLTMENPPVYSENSSGSSSPVSSASSDQNKLSNSNLSLQQAHLSISSFAPNSPDQLNERDNLYLNQNTYSNKENNNYQSISQQNNHGNQNTSTDTDSAANSSDQSSISASSTPTYRSPQSVSYSSHMYGHHNQIQNSTFVPYNQYQGHQQSHYNNYFNSGPEFSHYNYNNQEISQIKSEKQEYDYLPSSNNTLPHSEENLNTLPNMLNCNPMHSNPYAQAAASVYYNSMNINPYYSPQYFPNASTQSYSSNSNSTAKDQSIYLKSNKIETPQPVNTNFNKISQPQHAQQPPVPSYDFNNSQLNTPAQNFPPSANAVYPNMPKNQTTNPNIKVKLQDMSLWKQFNQIGTEMIITKCGRRMFPSLRVSVSGLEASAKYVMVVDIVPVDDNRYKYHNCEWIVSGKAEAHFVGRGYLHPDSPLTGVQWSKQIISFHKLKLTNNPFDRAGHIILNSMHKYVPRIHIIEEGKSINTYVLNECVFTAVTAYQNELVTKLKIEYNPFAKGFRDGQNRQGFRGNASKRSSDDENDSEFKKEERIQERPFNPMMTRVNSGYEMNNIR